MSFFPSHYNSCIQYHSNPNLCPNCNAKEAEFQQFYEDLQDLLELTPKKDVLFIIGEWSEVKSLSHDRLFVTPWTVAYHIPPSMGFSSQEYWSGLPFPSPEDLPEPGIKPTSVSSHALAGDSLPLRHLGSPINDINTIQTLVICYEKNFPIHFSHRK